MGIILIPNTGGAQPEASTPFDTPAGLSLPYVRGAFCKTLSYLSQLTAGGINGLHLYKGSIPSQSELDAIDAATLEELPRNSDLLCLLSVRSYEYTPSNVSVTLHAAKAIRSGVIGWYMLYSTGASGPQAIAGTVSEHGQGGAVELLSTSLNAGHYCKLPKMSLGIKTKFSW